MLTIFFLHAPPLVFLNGTVYPMQATISVKGVEKLLLCFGYWVYFLCGEGDGGIKISICRQVLESLVKLSLGILTSHIGVAG